MSSMNAIAVEAYKKYVVVSLIHHGQVFVLLDFFKGYPFWHSKTNFMTSKLRVQCNNLILECKEPVLECQYRYPIQIVACIFTKKSILFSFFFYFYFLPGPGSVYFSKYHKLVCGLVELREGRGFHNNFS